MYRLCIPRGYKWCGPGCSGPGEPINNVDAACKEHDQCYGNTRNYCECDRIFLHRLAAQINQPSKEGRDARFLYNYMKMQSSVNCSFRNNKKR